MGAYIKYYDNLNIGSKEEWLEQNATPIVGPPKEFDRYDGYFVVCLVDNGSFTAAGICFSQRELEVFNCESDSRPKKWYVAKIKDLYSVSEALEIYFPKKNIKDDFELSGAL